MKDAVPDSFEIKSIQRSEPPVGAEGSVWCRYVLKQGDNIIRGYRPGPLKTVRGEIKALVKQLNDRRSSNKSQMAPIRRTRH